MFTGIIEEVGEIVTVEELDRAKRFRIRAAVVLDGLSLGDSVSVDGACQTVAAMGSGTFDVVSVASTLSRTILAEYEPGRRVNLERALSFGARLGGHLVQGHVDGIGSVARVSPLGESIVIDFAMPAEVAAVTVLHGSIALNGISLTVNALPAPAVAQVSIVPFTLSHTNIGALKPGDQVNLEGDLIGRYVRHLLGVPGGKAAPAELSDLSRSWGY